MLVLIILRNSQESQTKVSSVLLSLQLLDYWIKFWPNRLWTTKVYFLFLTVFVLVGEACLLSDKNGPCVYQKPKRQEQLWSFPKYSFSNCFAAGQPPDCLPLLRARHIEYGCYEEDIFQNLTIIFIQIERKIIPWFYI